jgi:bifunctional non-homologous end joining protein LigD
MAAKRTQVVEIEGRTLAISNVDKVLWPEDGYTKGELIAYYRAVSRWLLPHLENRPLTLQRWPDGVDAESFFEKNAPRGLPDWVPTHTVESEGGRHSAIRYIVCNDEPTLAYVANLASITVHVWMSRIGELDNPDYVLFDLDPWEGCTVGTLAKVALAVRESLEPIGLKTLVKTSGSSGLHVVVPLKPLYDYAAVKTFAELIARHVESRCPGDVTLERITGKRPKGTVYIDYLQVGKSKTIVPPYVVRAKRGAPVSMPLSWDEVSAMRKRRAADTTTEMRKFTIANVPAILAERGDAWSAALGSKQRLEPALKRARSVWEAT